MVIQVSISRTAYYISYLPLSCIAQRMDLNKDGVISVEEFMDSCRGVSLITIISQTTSCLKDITIAIKIQLNSFTYTVVVLFQTGCHISIYISPLSYRHCIYLSLTLYKLLTWDSISL